MNLLDLCRSLKGLAPEDRAWIFSQLSSAAKMKLARALGADGPLYEPTATAKAMRLLDARDADAVLEALEDEPSWVVYAVWRATAWSWRRKLLRALPPAVRLDLQTLEREGCVVSPAVTQFLLRALAEQVTKVAKPSPVSLFERLLRRATRRAA
jgi:hypothetical protein